MKDFWKKECEKGKLVFLAPMDGYTDSAYRQVVKKVSPKTICVTEFYSADGLVNSKFLADSVLPHKKMENPLIVQIFGKEPENFVKAAKIIEKYDVAGIDINMGCPARKVINSGHGSGLIINRDTAFEIVEKLNKATHLPISVKTRLGWDGASTLIEFVKGLENAGASLVTVHGRTTKQAYTGMADFTQIYELKKNVGIPIICNGDVKNYEDGLRKINPYLLYNTSPLTPLLTGEGNNKKNSQRNVKILTESQNLLPSPLRRGIEGEVFYKEELTLDGFMIGRGSFGNPWCFLNENDYLEKKEELSGKFLNGQYFPTLKEILEMMKFHAQALIENKGEKKGTLDIRKHLVQYLKGFPGVSAYRKELVTIESFEKLGIIIGRIEHDYKEFLGFIPSEIEITV